MHRGPPLNKALAVMRKGVPLVGNLVTLAIVSAGCAAPYVGTWENESRSFRLVLAEDGTCTMAAPRTHIGSIGGRCIYSRAGDIVTITALGELDGSGRLEPIRDPLQIKIGPTGQLTMLNDNGSILKRVAE